MSWKMTSGRCREEEDSSERDSVCMKAGRYEIMGKKTRKDDCKRFRIATEQGLANYDHTPNMSSHPVLYGLWAKNGFYNTLKCLENNHKKNILWCMKIRWNSICVHKYSLIGMQIHSLVYILYIVAFTQQLQSWVIETEDAWSALIASHCCSVHYAS